MSNWFEAKSKKVWDLEKINKKIPNSQSIPFVLAIHKVVELFVVFSGTVPDIYAPEINVN